MRVGVYVDGFNLYYGGRSQFTSASGWKWLDLRALASRYATWGGSVVDRVVYCTARVNDPSNPAQTQRQAFYLQALLAAGSVDEIEEGYYSSWATESVLVNEPSGTRAPTELLDPTHALQWSAALPVRRTQSHSLLATIRKREEKGSDVNVATHLLVDALSERVDAAIVISNDSDLALPVRVARDHVPVGLLNPSKKPLAGALKGTPQDGVGRHWWRRMQPTDWTASQLPSPTHGITKPLGW